MPLQQCSIANPDHNRVLSISWYQVPNLLVWTELDIQYEFIWCLRALLSSKNHCTYSMWHKAKDCIKQIRQYFSLKCFNTVWLLHIVYPFGFGCFNANCSWWLNNKTAPVSNAAVLVQWVVWDLRSRTLQMFSVVVLLRYLSYRVWRCCCEALVEEDQRNKTEVTSNKGQLPHALRWKGVWTSCSIWKGWWQSDLMAARGPCARGRQRPHWWHVHLYVGTHARNTQAHSSIITQARIKTDKNHTSAHVAETTIMPSEIA